LANWPEKPKGRIPSGNYLDANGVLQHRRTTRMSSHLPALGCIVFLRRIRSLTACLVGFAFCHGLLAQSAPDSAGTDTMAPAASSAPTITTQPASKTVTAGQSASFTVVASGTAPLSYQWKLGSSNISGATSATYTISATTTASAGSYTVVVTNSAGSKTSNVATLTVNKAAQAAVTITSASTVAYGTAYTATATGGSGTGAIVWTLATGSTAAGAAINASTGVVTFTGTGKVVFNAYRAADASYNQSATTANFTLTVGKGTQAVLTVNSSATVAYGTAYTATATGGSGTGAIVWTLATGSTAAGAAINASTGVVTFTGTGKVVFNAYRAADANYNQSATTANFTLTVNKGTQAAVTITSALTVALGTAYTATATGGSGTGAIVWTLATGSTAKGAAINASTGVVTFTGTGTVLFNAYRAADANYNQSATTANFTLTVSTAVQAVAPTFNPVAGTYTSAQSVTITSGTGGASIAYTTDGSTPTESGGTVTHGTVYSTPVPIASTTTLTAIAFKTGYTDSTATVGKYTLNLPVAAAPTFNPVAGTYTSAQSVTITPGADGASIAYTTDNSTPTASGGTITHGTLYSTPLDISATTTLKAIAFKTGYTPSGVNTGIYTIKVATPGFSPGGKTYTYPITVAISCSTSGATIHYTTDGSTPSQTNGILYSASNPVNINVTTTLKAIAYESGMADSSVKSSTYTLNLPPAAAPVFDSAAGTYSSAQNVVITTATNGVAIAYTTDGTTPTASGGSITHGTLYSSPLTISSATTLTAISYGIGFSASPVTSGTYAFGPPAAAPVFSISPGIYTSAQTVTITTTTSGASIRYTIDGSTPTQTNGTLISGPVSISSTTMLKAVAYKSGSFASSPVTSGLYAITSSAAPVLNVLYNFTASNNGGIVPAAGLIQGTDGDFYGATSVGGSANCGTVFKMTPTGVLTALASFEGVNGSGPNASLLQGSDGNFYGTTSSGGNSGDGTVFKITPAGALTTLVSFCGTNGDWPQAALVQGSDGNFYGTTEDGGPTNDYGFSAGTIFRITPAGVLTTLVYLARYNGLYPKGLVQGSDGNFYGTAEYGGMTNQGVVFRMSPAGVLTSLFGFMGDDASGAYPMAALVQGSDGNFYGTTEGGGSGGNGTVFKITPAGVLTTLASFGGANGANPMAALVQGSDGNFYGTTQNGGSGSNGTIFQMTLAGVLTTLISFDGVNGANPGAALVQGSDGNFYGTATNGGVSNHGVVFQLITQTAASPLFSPAPGSSASAQTVAITSATSGAFIAYTTDGSTPTESGGAVTHGTLYSTPVVINATTMLKAIAFRTGFADSGVASGTFTIAPLVAAPAFNPPSGTYNSVQTVTISSAASGASIAYTTDGTMPTESGGTVTHGTLYTAPVPVFGATTTLKAIAFASGYTDSMVTSGIYTNTNPPPLAPVFSPGDGTYTSAQAVTITCAGANAIYYTTDGSTPTSSSTPYTVPVPIANNTVLQAVATNGGGAGPVTSASFTILPPAPVFSPPPGAYANVTSLSVTISDGADAAIYYTTNGATPTNLSTPYTAPVLLPVGTTWLKAIAINSNGFSTITGREYVLTPPPPLDPVLSLASGTYRGAQSVTISSSGADTIYYTTDGTTPTSSSTLYNGPVLVAAGMTLQAIGANSGGSSNVTSRTYAIIPIPSAPVFSFGAGIYNSAQSVGIISSGATSIYYTTDGSTPTNSSTLYSGPIWISTSATLQAIGVNSFGSSDVAGGTYTILPPVVAPVFSPAPGNYASVQSVSITSVTNGASIFYTTDGSIPTETNGTLYSGPVSLSSPTMLKAIACASGFADSAVTGGNYTIISPGAILNVLHNFLPTDNEGIGPGYAALVQGSDGNFYGTTWLGGSNNAGTVFKMTSAGVLTTLASFGGANGSTPMAALVQGSDGNFYGTTEHGGNRDYGTIFKMTPAGVLTTLVQFDTTNGYWPTTGLVQGSDGNFYGTTPNGGSSYQGTVFKMTPAGVLTTLVSFDGTSMGSPSAALVQGSDGNFYGVSEGGNGGFIFKVTPAGVLTSLASFNGTNGSAPEASLVQGSNGNFYGMTRYGGSSNNGTVFMVTPAGLLTSLVSFSGPDGAWPRGGTLVQGSDGNFYGMTPYGGVGGTYGYGTIFKMTPAGVLTTLVFFDGTNEDGAFAGLVQGSDGNFYGTAGGSVFQLITQATAVPVFSPAPGSYIGAQTLTISTTTSGASIRYTTDGSTPSRTYGTPYSGPVPITQPGFLQAIAYSPGIADSPITGGYYTIFPPAAAPLFSVAPGTYTSVQAVSITSATSGTTIRYTTDGSTPSETDGTIYSGPVSISSMTILNAIAYGMGLADSTVTSATYTINLPQTAAAPVFSPTEGAQAVTIASATSGASIRYTTDGSPPTKTNGTLYAGPVSISAPITIKAIAFEDGFADSPVTSVTIGMPTITITTPADGSTISN
jgi:uncharacterized repeat protein (TIGR03803 family)